MDTRLLFQNADAFEAPLLAIFAANFSTAATDSPSIRLLSATPAVAAAAQQLLDSGEFKGGLGETALLHNPAGLKAARLLIVGAGKTAEITSDAIRKAAGTAVRATRQRSLKALALALPTGDESTKLTPSAVARAVVEGVELGAPDYNTYRSDRKEVPLETVSLICRSADGASDDAARRGFEEGLVLARAQNFTRALVNEPGNVLTPTVLGERAKAMCDEAGLKCEVYSTEKIRELRMEAFWSVAKGSAQPPALIVIHYEPKVAPEADAPVLGLVGKGITFDTGGISIKPADGMEKMKYDMAGAAAMIGAMKAIAELKPAVRVKAVICSAENMPDGAAFKPGDVVTAMSGKTIEIVNTDAEGRLVLADGLHYAKTLGCTHLIDAATLTGACMVALGLINFGVFSNDETTYERFTQALSVSGEKGWRLPCTDDYRDHIQSQIADIINTGNNRYGGATSAAMFLKEFAGDTPWVHLDIAGCAWNEEKKPWIAYGPSGVAVRSIVEWVRAWAG